MPSYCFALYRMLLHFNTLNYTTVKWSVVQYGAMQCSVVQYSASLVQYYIIIISIFQTSLNDISPLVKALGERKDEIMDLRETGRQFCKNNSRGWAVDRRYETAWLILSRFAVESQNANITRVLSLKWLKYQSHCKKIQILE